MRPPSSPGPDAADVPRADARYDGWKRSWDVLESTISCASVIAAALVALAALAPPPAHAADPRPLTDELPRELTDRIADGEASFQIQNYERVVQALDRLAGHPRLEGRPEHIRVLEMLGSSHWFLGAPDSSRLVFGQLLRESPFHRLDGFVYPAELIDFYEVRRRELVTAGIIPATPSESDTFAGRRVLVREVTSTEAPAVVYLMPFGVGQFVNGDSGKGAAVAVIQGIGAATMIASWIGIEGLKVGDTNRVLPGDGGQARLLEALWYGGMGVMSATWAFSIVDGFVSRDTTPRVNERFELLEPGARSPEPGPTSTPNLRLGLTPLGLEVDLRF